MNDSFTARRHALALILSGGLLCLAGCGSPEAGSMPAAKKSKKDVLGIDDGQIAPASKSKSTNQRAH